MLESAEMFRKKQEAPTTTLTDEQREALVKLWFVYGNKGPKHSHAQHKWIQGILEQGRDYREHYRGFISEECLKEVDRIGPL